MSERKVGESFEQLFRKAHNKRIVVATFASISIAYSRLLMWPSPEGVRWP